MAYEQRKLSENRGVLKKNTKKEHEKQPYFKGGANVEGNFFYVSGWIDKETKDIRLAFSRPKQEKPRKDYDNDPPF